MRESRTEENLDAAIASYLNGMEKNSSRAYLTAITDFLYFSGRRSMFKYDVSDCVNWVEELRRRKAPDGKPYASKTINGYFDRVAAIFSFLCDSNFIDFDPFKPARRLISWRQKREKRPTKLIPFEKVAQFLDTPDPTTREGIRDRALLALLFGGGLRLSEAQALQVGQVQVTPLGSPFVLLAHTKSGTTQTQAIPPWAYEAVSRLISKRKIENADEIDPLFVFYFRDGKTRNQPLSIRTLRRVYTEYSRACGIPAAPHSARATAASLLHAEGWSVPQIAQYLRHGSINTTARYIKISSSIDESLALKLSYVEGKKDVARG